MGLGEIVGRSYRKRGTLSRRTFVFAAILFAAPLVFADDPAQITPTEPAPDLVMEPGPIQLPLSDVTQWRTVTFGRTPTSGVKHDERGVQISVRNSSSPLVYLLETPMPVSAIEFSGRTLGLPRGITSDDDEWKRDDFPLRIGLLLVGEGGPNWFERFWGPAWIKDLVQWMPKSRFQKARLLVLAQKIPAGTHRVHPDSSYVEEEVIGNLPVPGRFQLRHEFRGHPMTGGVWVQADGDGTKSTYQMSMDRIEIFPGRPERQLTSPEQ